MIFCSQCGSTVQEGEQFCSECGGLIPAGRSNENPTVAPATQFVQPQSVQPVSAPASAPGAAIAPKQPTNTIALLAIPLGLLVLVVVIVIAISSSNRTSSS